MFCRKRHLSMKSCYISLALLVLSAFCFTISYFVSTFLSGQQWDYDKSLQYYYDWERKDETAPQIYASNSSGV